MAHCPMCGSGVVYRYDTSRRSGSLYAWFCLNHPHVVADPRTTISDRP
ncbi:hypothetical protein [Schumannella sp. 10F1B-5-1]|nr:hypothetical protein [Schumannella sp. 10F1B-5-1]